MYRKKEISLTKSQEKNVAKAITNNEPVNIKLSSSALKKKSGLDPLFLTQSQINRINKAQRSNSGLVLRLSKKQVNYMKQQAKKGNVGSGIGTILTALAPSLINAGTNLLGSLLSGNKKGEGMKRNNGKSKGSGVFLPGTFGRGNNGVPLNDFLKEMGCYCKNNKVYVKN